MKKVCFKDAKGREENVSDKLFILSSDNVDAVAEAMSVFVSSGDAQEVFHIILPDQIFFPRGFWTTLSSNADEEIKRLPLRIKGRSHYVWEYYEYVGGSLGLHKTGGRHYRFRLTRKCAI